MGTQEKTLAEKCRDLLTTRWKLIVGKIESGVFVDPMPPEYPEIRTTIVECLTSTTKSYHYVLPTQILCKCVNPRLDCHALQAAYRKPGAFDARTIAHDVVVPFDQDNHRVL